MGVRLPLLGGKAFTTLHPIARLRKRRTSVASSLGRGPLGRNSYLGLVSRTKGVRLSQKFSIYYSMRLFGMGPVLLSSALRLLFRL